MSWLGKVSLGGFPDLAGAVTKLSESVKNIEKNFDSALGLEEKPESSAGLAEVSGIWPLAADRIAIFDPVMSFVGHKGDVVSSSGLEKPENTDLTSSAEENENVSNEGPFISASEVISQNAHETGDSDHRERQNDLLSGNIATNSIGERHDEIDEGGFDIPRGEADVPFAGNANEADVPFVGNANEAGSVESSQKKGLEEYNDGRPHIATSKLKSLDIIKQPEFDAVSVSIEPHQPNDVGTLENHKTDEVGEEHLSDNVVPKQADVLDNKQLYLEMDSSNGVSTHSTDTKTPGDLNDGYIPDSLSPDKNSADSTIPFVKNELVDVVSREIDVESDNTPEKSQSMCSDVTVSEKSTVEVERLKKEMKQMEAALQGAARQAQVKADEIAKLLNENEQLKLTGHLKIKSTQSELDSLRDEYNQRVASLERKIYALTKERDTLKREQSKKTDAAALFKEKDEIISQVMAEGEELSKKQAAQESTIRKLRAQIRELEEEKQRLLSKCQGDESKVETLKRDKAATEKLLQETMERNQAELAAQKEFYTNALNTAKESQALAESRANSEARIELESRLREAGERETMLVLALEDLRQTLSRTEQLAVFREDMLQRDIEDLQKRYQASELRYNELITQVPESTRPLLRQIEAMQETNASRTEAWAGVERALNSRLQEAEAKAAAAEERELSLSERLSQTLSRITVLETQITCLRTEQTQLSRSLEKERQRASESRQEYLAAVEVAATQEGRAKQLENELRENKSKYKKELQEEIARRELVEKELERERDVRSELEKSSREVSIVADQNPMIKNANPYTENGNASLRKLSSAGSLGSMDESVLLQAFLDPSDKVLLERIPGGTLSPYFLKSMTPSVFEAALRQKDGEISSYISRLATLESIRGSLAEDLVKVTAQCEKLQAEAALIPGIQSELEALRQRHTAALELMGERDEELEELRADIVDLKEMYREQVDLLVNRIQTMSSSAGVSQSS